MTSTTTGTTTTAASGMASQLFAAALSCAELMTDFLGLELGLYAALAGRPATSSALAARAGVYERYAREWLEQQACSGVLEVDEARTFHLPGGHARALLDPDSPHYAAPLALLPVGALTGLLPRLAAAFRTGTPVPAEHFAGFHGAGLNGALYRRELRGWLAAQIGDPVRIADLACGRGDSTVELARAFPAARVDGVDADAAAVAAARAGLPGDVAGRVGFVAADVTGLPADRYDLVCVFDALHDMADPLAALRTCHRLVTDDGCVLLLEPRARDRFTAPGDPLERFLYACSVLHCLPSGMSDAATGAVLRLPVLRALAARAGFSALRPLPGGSRFHRLYRLDR